MQIGFFRFRLRPKNLDDWEFIKIVLTVSFMKIKNKFWELQIIVTEGLVV
jgi:hypothetical protein